MKKIVDYVEFLTACINAISKGIKVCFDNWPVNNPTSNRSDDNTNGVKV